MEEKACLSSYDNVNQSCEENNLIRSKADNLSLNQLITSSIEEDHHCRTNSIERSSNQQNKRQTNVNHHHDHSKDMTNEQDGNSSDGESNCSSSEDFRYATFFL